MSLQDKLAVSVLILTTVFIASSYWWDFGIIIAIIIIITFAMVAWMIDDYKKEKRLRALEAQANG